MKMANANKILISDSILPTWKSFSDFYDTYWIRYFEVRFKFRYLKNFTKPIFCVH